MSVDKIIMSHNGPHIERGYRETSAFQWAREVTVNAFEASATRIYFGVDWQSVITSGVYRRMIADDGCGLNEDDFHRFLKEFGGGGKPIGGVHENYGIGAKTTLLPWNRCGVVVISRKNGEDLMIRIERDEDNDYGFHKFTTYNDDGEADGMRPVVDPDFEDDDFGGINWSKCIPDWIEDHGTVIILLGNEPDHHTIEGDPGRKEDGIRLLAGYLNCRFWEAPLSISVEEFQSTDRWPSQPAAGLPGMGRDHYMARRVQGLKHWLARPGAWALRDEERNRIPLDLQIGTVQISPSVAVDWYLWEAPPTPAQNPRDNRLAPQGRKGGVTILYKNELYNWDSGQKALRNFGIHEQLVADNLWLVIRPPHHIEPNPSARISAVPGVYPTANRSFLAWASSGREALPFRVWEDLFRENLPDEIREAMRAARPDTPLTIEDPEWQRRLWQRFGARLSLERHRPDANGEQRADESNIVEREPGNINPRDPARTARRRGPRTRNTSTAGYAGVGDAQNANPRRLLGGLPRFIWKDDPVDEENKLIAAKWNPPSNDLPEGMIEVWRGHDFMQSTFHYYEREYSGYETVHVRKIIENVYAECMICRIVQSEALSAKYGRHQPSDTDLLDGGALTMGLIGLLSEDDVIKRRLRDHLGRRVRRASGDSDEVEIGFGVPDLNAP